MQSLPNGLPDNLKISGKPASHSRSSLQSAIAFGLFVFWLLSLPMEGPLMRSFILSLIFCILIPASGDDSNHAPAANAGPDQNIATGSVVTLGQ